MHLDAIKEHYLEKMAETFKKHKYPPSIRKSFEYAAKKWGNIHPSMTSYVIGSFEKVKGVKKNKLVILSGMIPVLESIINALDDIIDEDMERPEKFKIAVIITFGFLTLFDDLYKIQMKKISDFAKPLLGHKMFAEDVLSKIFTELITLSQIPESEKESEVRIIKAKSVKKELEYALNIQDMRSSGINIYLYFAYPILGLKVNDNFSNLIRSLRFLELVKDDIDDLTHDIAMNDPSAVSTFYKKYEKSPIVFRNRVNMFIDSVLERVDSDMEKMKDKKLKEASLYLKKKIDDNYSRIRKKLNQIKKHA